MVLFGDGARGARSNSDTLFFSCDIHGAVLRSDVTVVLIDHAQWLDAECWNLVRHLLKHIEPQQPTVHRSRKTFVVAAGNATMLSRRPRHI